MESAEKIERHQRFLGREPVGRPLLGCCIGGWEDLGRYVSDTESFFPKGPVRAADLGVERFTDLYDRYRDSLYPDDDLIRPMEPLPFFPWTEAAMGCPVEYTGKNFWARPWPTPMDPESLRCLASVAEYSTAYARMLDFLLDRYGPGLPVGQTILRGPLDMAAAALGEEKLLLSFYDRPEMVRDIIALGTDIVMSFLRLHGSPTLSFHGGHVLGSYYIWSPGSSARIQEDAMSLLSPDLYVDVIASADAALGRAAELVLYHIHSSGLHLLGRILSTQGFAVIQISKDQGVESIDAILPSLRAVQETGRCLIVKGRFSRRDVSTFAEALDFRGLCLQAVTDSVSEARDFYESW